MLTHWLRHSSPFRAKSFFHFRNLSKIKCVYLYRLKEKHYIRKNKHINTKQDKMEEEKKGSNKCFDKLMINFDIKPRITGIMHDPIEESEIFLSIEKELEYKLESYFNSKMSYDTHVSCFEYWRVMKQMLREVYQIEWMSPVELNPTIFQRDNEIDNQEKSNYFANKRK